jgi:hypothetical protein
LVGSASSIAMKLDTQGYESAVIRGAAGCLERISLIEMEMSLVALYEGESLFFETCEKMQAAGYSLIDVEHEFSDPRTGRLLQVNGIFKR